MILRTFLMITILALVVPRSSQQMINEGASTSTGRALDRCEECELENYAIRLSNLLTAEDRSIGDLSNIVGNGRGALAAFHDEVFSYITLARFSAMDLRDPQRRERRIQFFFLRFRQSVLQKLMNACSEHYRYHSWLEYNGRAIIHREDMAVLPDYRCLCGNYEERVNLETPFTLPLNSEPSSRNFQIYSDQHQVTVYETAQYHVIPVPLIVKFFEEWLAGDDGQYLNSAVFNNCVVTLYRRLKRSLQKLVISQIVNTQDEWCGVSYNSASDNVDTIYREVLTHSRSWLDGNVFLGPIHRGPFDPRYGLDRDRIMETVEKDAKDIVGSDRYYELLYLYTAMRNFIANMPKENPLWRLVVGLDTYVIFYNIICREDLTPMIDEHWEERTPTDDDLRNIEDESDRDKMRSQSFWAIKRASNNRAARRTREFEKDHIDFAPVFGLTSNDPKSLWSKFTMELMTMSIQSKELPEPPIWLCNFTRLYNEYLFREKKPPSTNLNCPNCIGFDDYLYEKVSSHSDWQNCNEGDNVTHKWCLAWKNITKDLNREYNRYEVDGQMVYNLFDVPKSLSFLKNVKTMVRWLSSITGSEETCTRKKESFLTKFGPGPVNAQDFHKSSIDYTMCYLATFAISILSKKNDCWKTFGSQRGIF